MLTLHAPRAMARLRLNVKGFNMGDRSPWQSFDPGRRIRPAGAPHPRSVHGIFRRRVFPRTRGLPALPFSRCHLIGAPESSPGRKPWRVTRSIVIPIPGLEFVSCFLPRSYGDPSCRFSRSEKMGAMRKNRRRHNPGIPLFRRDPASPEQRVHVTERVKSPKKKPQPLDRRLESRPNPAAVESRPLGTRSRERRRAHEGGLHAIVG